MAKFRHAILPLLFCVTLFAACRDDKQQDFTFNARIEQPTNTDGSKVYLDEERWVYWELGDEITIGSDICYCDGDTAFTARLVDVASQGGGIVSDYGYFNGVFITTMAWGSSYFLGLHPKDHRNRIYGTPGSSVFSTQIYLADTQRRRTIDAREDYTFDRQVYPMVAWYGGYWDTDGEHAFNLDFHSVAGIIRLNLFNNSGEYKTLRSIEITSRDGRQLKGLFNIKDYNIEDPYLESLSNNEADRTVVLYCGNDGKSFPANQQYTFYLVLPAYGGRSVTTTHNLTMKVNATDGSSVTKNFHAPVRRTGLTNMQAMGIDDWQAGTASIGLSGCGEEARPFKVYDTTDLKYLRDCYNSDDPVRRINGQPITSDTWIAIMRSDIVINDTNWKAGINNFVGHLIDLSHQSHPGITSRSTKPLFQKISDGGVVEGITLKCGSMFTENTPVGVTPFCGSNSGEIRNCAITSEPNSTRRITSVNTKMAGICRENTNTGKIVGCRNDARMEVQQGYDLAGICLDNRGTIKECFVSSEMKAYVADGAHVAGICLDNNSMGTVEDCYFATRVTSTGTNDAYWAGIVYTNRGTVKHCYFSSTSHIYTTKDVGGIVAENIGTNSKVDYCWVAGQLRGVNVGGIVKSMASGKVINCFNSASAIVTVTDASSYGGGLVGQMSGGSIENSYVDDILVLRLSENATIGGIVGDIIEGTVNNCYDYEDNRMLYGHKTDVVNITNSFLVDGSQDGLTQAQLTGLVAMQTSLNTNKPVDGKSWQGAVDATTTPTVTSGTLPYLETYAVPSAKRRR